MFVLVLGCSLCSRREWEVGQMLATSTDSSNTVPASWLDFNGLIKTNLNPLQPFCVFQLKFSNWISIFDPRHICAENSVFDISDFPPASADNHCCTSSNQCKIDEAEQTSDQGTLKIWKNNRGTQDRSKWVVEEGWESSYQVASGGVLSPGATPPTWVVVVL